MFRTVELFLDPIDIFDKIGERKSELSNKELGFICGLIRMFKPKKIVEVGVSAGGTTAVILNCLNKLNIYTNVYCVDLAYTYHYDITKECGFQIKDALKILKRTANHELILGKTIAQVLPEICENEDEKIDMLILDTIHYLPGELLDFIVCLPYLSQNAIVVLDDLTFAHFGENREALATKILFDTVVAEKYVPYINEYPKMAAFKLNADTKKYSMNLFSALVTPWGYEMPVESIVPYTNLISRHYSHSEQNIFTEAYRINQESLHKLNNISDDIKNILEICESGKKTVIYGAGSRGRALYDFLSDRGKYIYGFVVSDDRKQSNIDDKGRRVFSLSNIKETEEDYCVILAAADEEIRNNLYREKITFYEAPNYIFPFIKNYVRYIL